MSPFAANRARILVAGGVVALALALIYVVAGSGATYEVKAVFEDVRGLIPGGEVKAGAEKVGSVKDIELDEDGLPLVTMTIDDDFQLNQGAFANIRLASNVGGVNRFVDLEEGDGPPLADGATLGPSQTDHPVDFDLALSDLDPKTREELGHILAGLDQTLKGRGAYLDRALRHSATALGETANLLHQVNADQRALRTVIGEGRKVVGALAADPGNLGETTDRLASVLQVTAARQQELRRTAQALGPGLSSARALLEEVRESVPNLQRLIDAAAPAVGEIVPTARDLGPVIEALRPLLGEARALLDDAPAQLEALQPVLDVAAPVVKRLDPLMKRLGPVVDYLRVWAPDMVAFFTLWGDAAANYDAVGHLARLGFTSANTVPHPNEIKPSDPGPGLIERPFYRTPGALEGEAWLNYWKSFVGGGKSIDSLYEPGEGPPP